MRATCLCLLVFGFTTTPALGQHDHGHSPYAVQKSADVASLTPVEIDDLRSAAGMGLARPAELNHYPGPKHSLELAAVLDLTDDQFARIEEIRREMERDAVGIGEAIIEAERSLNMRFDHGHIDESSLRVGVQEIARLSGELRFAHLLAHVQTTRVLTPAQIAAYDRERGYQPR